MNSIATALPSHYASFGRRFLATILDGLVLLIPCAIASHIIPYLGGLAVWFFYAPVLEASEMRATLGKYWMGIQVTDTAGKRLSFQAAVIRNLLKLASSTLLFIGHFFALFTEKSQAVHDLLADSVVIYGRDELPLWDTWKNSMRQIFSAPAAHQDRLSQLERLQGLRERGAITEEEYQAQKQKILSE